MLDFSAKIKHLQEISFSKIRLFKSSFGIKSHILQNYNNLFNYRYQKLKVLTDYKKNTNQKLFFTKQC